MYLLNCMVLQGFATCVRGQTYAFGARQTDSRADHWEGGILKVRADESRMVVQGLDSGYHVEEYVL